MNGNTLRLIVRSTLRARIESASRYSWHPKSADCSPKQQIPRGEPMTVLNRGEAKIPLPVLLLFFTASVMLNALPSYAKIAGEILSDYDRFRTKEERVRPTRLIRNIDTD